MVKPADHLKQTLTNLRSRLADEREYYMAKKKQLELYYPNEWKIVSPAIVAVANYLHGEIVRAKHDVADWMNGHEVQSGYGKSDAVEEIHKTINELPEMLELASKASVEHNNHVNDPMGLSTGAGANDYQAAMSDVEGALVFIKDLTTGLEEISYGER